MSMDLIQAPLTLFSGTISSRDDLGIYLRMIVDCMQSHRKSPQILEALWASLMINPKGRGVFSICIPHPIRITAQLLEISKQYDVHGRDKCTFIDGLYTGKLTLNLSHPNEILCSNEKANNKIQYKAMISLDNLQYISKQLFT